MADNVIPAILSLIRSKSDLVALFGDNPQRIYPNVLPGGLTTFPAATYDVVSQVGNRTFDGASRYDFNNIDFTVYGSNKSSVDAATQALRRHLEDSKGTFEDVFIAGVSYVGGGADGWNDTMNKYSKQIELKIDHKRTRTP